jgi:hypothetical protein
MSGKSSGISSTYATAHRLLGALRISPGSFVLCPGAVASTVYRVASDEGD